MSEDERMMEDFDRMEPDEDLNNEMMESSFEKELGGVEGGETTDISNERELNAREVYGNVEPHIGMEFESEKAAMMYYEAYGERVGFVIRVNFAQRSRDKSVVSRTFVCNKEGFRKEDRRSKSEVRNPRPVTRVGCKAMFTVRKEKPGKWIVTRLETKHNHPLGIPSGQGRRSAVQPRQFRPQDEKDKRIRELTSELHRANQRADEYREHLNLVLKDIDRHTNNLTKSVQDIVKNVKEIESKGKDH